MEVFVWYRGRVVDIIKVSDKSKKDALLWAKAVVVHRHGDNAPYHEFEYTVLEKTSG